MSFRTIYVASQSDIRHRNMFLLSVDQCSPIFFWIWKNPISGPFPVNVWKMGQDLNLGNGKNLRF